MQTVTPEIEATLSKAGENREELLRVIRHYQEEGDSLKLKAALFLIENMTYHYFYESKESIQYYNALDSALSTVKTKNSQILTDLTDSLAGVYSPLNQQIKKDIYHISADYMIRSIDEAFNIWETSPWCQHLNYDDFCEYLLPYRLKDGTLIEEREAIRNVLIDEKLKALLNSFQYSSEMQSSAFRACIAVNDKLKELDPEHSPNNPLSIYKLSTRAKIPAGVCDEYAIITATVMRSLGIPVGIDYTPQWPNRSLGHTWNTLLSNSGKILSFGGADTNTNVLHKPDAKMAKVYRLSYAINPDFINMLQSEKQIPSTLNNPHVKDVTSDYMRTSTIYIPITYNRKHTYAYLAVFNNNKWIPVCFEQRKNNSFCFKNIGRDIVYLPVYYEKGEIISMADPFLLDKNGNIKCLQADLDNKEKVILYRKHYYSERMYKYAQRCLGAYIEASNDSKFSQSDTLYTINKFSIYQDTILIKNSKCYRYWRYVSQPTTLCNLAELSFEHKGKELTGVIIGTDGVYDPSATDVTDKYKVFDKDPLTYFDAPKSIKNAWVGMDFKTAVSIDKIIYTPRNDGNNIEIGDLYELFYWNKDEWVSLGKQKAKEMKLLYSNVPSNALLLLKNLTKGKEHRIFTYENNQQKWW